MGRGYWVDCVAMGGGTAHSLVATRVRWENTCSVSEERVKTEQVTRAALTETPHP